MKIRSSLRRRSKKANKRMKMVQRAQSTANLWMNTSKKPS